MANTLTQNAYDYLRRRLIDGTFCPGTRLSPAALAQEIGISHIPVREAIGRLQSEGLVEQLPRRGAFVRQPDREEIVELVELRGLLECGAIVLTARRISDSQLLELRQALDELRQAGDRLGTVPREEMIGPAADWMLADMAFHLVLLRGARNRQLLRFVEHTHVLTRMFGHRSDHPQGWSDMPQFVAGNFQVHLDIHEAVRRHDPKAARRAMVAHTKRARRNLLARIDWLDWQPDASSPMAKDFPESMRELVREIERTTLENEVKKEAPDFP